jgi:hypothetical protein
MSSNTIAIVVVVVVVVVSAVALSTGWSPSEN